MNPKLKAVLIIAAKHAVNAILTNGTLMGLMSGTFHMHSRQGWMNILRLTAGVVVSREGLVWLPKILKWSQSNLEGVISMKSILSLVAVLGLVAAAAGQAPAPSPNPTPDPEAIESNVGIHAEPFSDMVKLNGSAGTATVAGLRIPVLPRHSVLASQWMVPAINSTFTFGEWEFRERADHLLPAKNVLIPLNAIQVFARGGLGVRRADNAGNEFAYTVQGGLSVAVGKVAGGVVVIDLKGGFLGSGSLKSPGTRLPFGSSGLVSVGAALKF